MISIIIPVYNTGTYLIRCVDSIIHQTYKDLEIIIVDDGSRTETYNICDTLATRDSRVRVFHKKNEGVSVARNFGLSKSKGDYIGFVDSDDWINPYMYEKLLNNLTESCADVVYCDALTIWDNGEEESDTFANLHNSGELKDIDVTPSILYEIAGSVCRGLYRRELLEGIDFPVGLKFSEDRFFNLQVLSNAKLIYYLKEPFYYRYMREDSCVNSYHQDAVQVTCKGFSLMADYAKRFWGEEYSEEYERKQMVTFIGLLYSSLHCGKGFWGKYQEFKKIASTLKLHSLIKKYGAFDVRLKLIKMKFYFPLFLLISLHAKIRKY